MQITNVVVIGHENPIAALELAHTCGADLNWVVQLVEAGVIELQHAAEAPDAWTFYSVDLHRALEARRLERDFGVGLEAAALILDLQNEVRRLKAALAAQQR
jgi:chaperone modulatory protein CbpM